MEKLMSRKLAVTLLYAVIAALNTKLGLGLSENVLLSLAGVAGAYLLGQSYVDAKENK